MPNKLICFNVHKFNMKDQGVKLEILSKWRLSADVQYTPSLPINPFSPHDALKHHFTSLKTHLIFLQQRVLEQKLP